VYTGSYDLFPPKLQQFVFTYGSSSYYFHLQAPAHILDAVLNYMLACQLFSPQSKLRFASSVVGKTKHIPQMVVNNGDLPW